MATMSQQLSTVEKKHTQRHETSQRNYQLTIMELEKDAEMAQLMVNEYRNLIMVWTNSSYIGGRGWGHLSIVQTRVNRLQLHTERTYDYN